MIMLIGIIIILFHLRVATSQIPSYKPYYGQRFINFSKEMRPNNLFLETIFSNLDSMNTSELCISHLKIYKEAIQSDDNTWSMYYQDSSGCSLEPGALSGNIINFGDFDECVFQSNEMFQGKYCLLEMELHGEMPHRLPYVPKNSPIVFSLCVPDSCGPEDIQVLTKPLAERWNFSLSSECQMSRPPLSPFDTITVCFFAIVLLLTLSTVIPKELRLVRNAGVNAVWNCFDINENLNMLCQSEENSNILACLYAIRFFSQCVVIWFLTLRTVLVCNYPVKNKFVFNDILREWTGTYAMALITTNDTFFMMSGLLLTYNCLKRKSNLNLIKYYFHRYLRLTPPLLATLLFVSTFWNKLCEGPRCNMDVDKSRDICRSYWWMNVLYINNLFSRTKSSCMAHTWFLSAEWQLFLLVSPIVVMVINKWPQHIYKVIAAIHLSSVVSTILVSFLYNTLPDNLLFNSDEEGETYFNKFYSSPAITAGPWAIGIYLGVILHSQKEKPLNLSSRSVVLGWCACVVGMFGIVFYNIPLLQDPPPSLWLRSVFGCLQRNIYLLGVGWIIFASATNKAGPLGTFLSSEVFEPVGKLTYCMYLIQTPIISLYMDEVRNSNYFSTVNILPPVMGLIFICTMAGLLLYLTFEAPFIHVEKLIFRKGNSSIVEPQVRSGNTLARDKQE